VEVPSEGSLQRAAKDRDMVTQSGLKEPLADRLRPKNLDEVFGQEKLIGGTGVLRKTLESGRIFSFILWGPPGSGKTTLARLSASMINAHFVEFSAVTSGVAEVRKTIEEAKKFKNFGTQTILFVDEIHRFNKAQQDAFLPHVENGTFILIGATTENPFFEVTAPLLSRLKIFRLEPLSEEVLGEIIKKGCEALDISAAEKGIELLTTYAAGDARRALNALEAVHLAYSKEKNLTEDQIRSSLDKNVILYDKTGDYHYDTISAFIKSLRGSDPDAALHWLARMLKAGEDPRFIARRMVILASEDIGNADPFALVLAVSAAQGVEFVGMPEARLILAHAAAYLAAAPKSNASYLALEKALGDIENETLPPVPLHLRNAAVPQMKKFGTGIGYHYPHDFPGHFVEQQYLPEGWNEKIYYEPEEQGKEAEIRKRLKVLWKKRRTDP
jgi:putative ATPase